MRLSPCLQLAAAAVMVCIASSEKTDVNYSSRVQSDAGIDSAVPDGHLLSTSNTTKEEERAPLPLLAAKIKAGPRSKKWMAEEIKFFDDIRQSLKQPLVPSTSNAHLLEVDKRAMEMQRQLDEEVLVRYWHTIKNYDQGAYRRLENDLTNKSPEKKFRAMREWVQHAGVQDYKMGSTDAEAYIAERGMEWLQSGLSIDQVFKLLQLDAKGINFLASREFHILVSYVKLYNAHTEPKIKLVEALTEGFGGKAEFARTLSNARQSMIHRNQAEVLQKKTLAGWVEDEKSMSVDDVFNMMRLESKKDQALSYADVDTVATYITVYDKKHPQDKIDAVEYLSNKLGGDCSLALLLYQARAASYDTSLYEALLFQTWWDRKLTPQTLYFSVFKSASHDDLYDVNAILSDYTVFYKNNLRAR